MTCLRWIVLVVVGSCSHQMTTAFKRKAGSHTVLEVDTSGHQVETSGMQINTTGHEFITSGQQLREPTAHQHESLPAKDSMPSAELSQSIVDAPPQSDKYNCYDPVWFKEHMKPQAVKILERAPVVRLKEPDWDEELRIDLSLFNDFDTDGDGYISRDDLTAFLSKNKDLRFKKSHTEGVRQAVNHFFYFVFRDQHTGKLRPLEEGGSNEVGFLEWLRFWYRSDELLFKIINGKWGEIAGMWNTISDIPWTGPEVPEDWDGSDMPEYAEELFRR